MAGNIPVLKHDSYDMLSRTSHTKANMIDHSAGLKRTIFPILVALIGLLPAVSSAQGTFYSAGGLTWAPIVGVANFETARKTCAGLIDGKTGWRLPTTDDLSATWKFDADDRPTFARAISPKQPDLWVWTAGPVRARGGREGKEDEAKEYRYQSGLHRNESGVWGKEANTGSFTCVRNDIGTSKPIVAEKKTVAPQTASNPSGAATPKLVLTQKDTSAVDAAKAKAKQEADRRRVTAAKQEAVPAVPVQIEGKVVNQVISGDSLEESQAKTWCERRVPEFKQRLAKGGDKLINMGNCSCNAGGAAVALSKQFKCEFAVSFRRFTPSGAR